MQFMHILEIKLKILTSYIMIYFNHIGIGVIMVALVTGASKGIGLCIVKELVKIGYQVLSCSRTVSRELARLIEENPNIKFFKCDISNKNDREDLTSFVSENYDGIDLLVNNAGVAPKIRKDILEIDESDYDYVMDINLKGTFFITQKIAGLMARKKSGRIINISSISAYAASVDRAQYCIAKAGIQMITKLYTARLADYGIGVFEICPGIIDTDMTAVALSKYESLIDNGLTPIQRLGTPEDVAKCVSVIASGNLDFCIGTVINADGGYNVRRL